MSSSTKSRFLQKINQRSYFTMVALYWIQGVKRVSEAETQKPLTAPIDLNTSKDILGKLLTRELESIYLMRYLIKNDH